MEEKTGHGFPYFECQISKYQDIYNCIKDNSICEEENWLQMRHEKCLVTEIKKLEG